MAGKSNRGRNKKGSQNNTAAAPSAAVPAAAVVKATEEVEVPENGHSNDNNLNIVEEQKVDANGAPAVEVEIANPEVPDAENASSEGQVKQGDINLFPVPVKTQFGENLELQLSPNDSVMDVRQFLLDAPETCFFTCYDLLLHTKDGSAHHLEDYHEISEVADITSGDCSLEMISALYDDRSIRAHVHRTRELLSLSTLHSSVSTVLQLQNEMRQKAAANSGVEAALQKRLVEEKAQHEHFQQLEIDQSQQRHAGDLEKKKRLGRMMKDEEVFQQRVFTKRESEFNKLKNERQERIDQIIQSRKLERETTRKMICYLKPNRPICLISSRANRFRRYCGRNSACTQHH